MARNPLASILDQNKLVGPNYPDWLRNLKIVLASEKLLYTLDKKPPAEAPSGSTAEEIKSLEKWWDNDLSTRCYMMASMSSELQRRYEEFAYVADIYNHLQVLFGEQTRSLRLATSKELFSSRLRDGASVHEHGVKIISLIEKLGNLEVTIPHELAVDLILWSLPSSFDGFVTNYTMNKIDCSLEELVNMLKNFETSIKKEKVVFYVGSSSKTKKGSKSKQKKRNGLKPQKQILKTKKKVVEDKKEEQLCFHCKKPGHWRRNCTEYLAQKRSEKAIEKK